jgi:ketosteroid isomerase-like protein
MADTATTETIARRYFDAWTSRDTATVVTLLSDGFQFAAGDMRIEGREAFLDAGAFPSDATTTMVAEAYQGDIGFQMYDATKGTTTVRVVEQLRVENGKIASSTFITDMAAFMSLLSPGDSQGDWS